MSRLVNEWEQFFDANGQPLASGLIDFYESGSNVVRKTTYADVDQTIPNPNPLVLNGDGRCPNVFGSGTYRAVLRTSAGVQLVSRDPVGGDSTLPFGSDWSSSLIYDVSDVAREGTNYYISQVNNNLNIRPVTDDGTNWQLAYIKYSDVSGRQTVTDYTALRGLSAIINQLIDGEVITVTDTGICGDFVLRNVVSHGLSDDAQDIIVIDSDWYAERIIERTLLANSVANGDFYIDSGSANAYVLSVVSPNGDPDVYSDGMTVRFFANNANAGASTVNVAGLGVKDLKDNEGNALLGGELVAGEIVRAYYDLSNDEFRLIPQLTQSSRVELKSGRKNAIINGNFSINQRGVSGTVVLAAGEYGHDRFRGGSAGCTYTFATSNNVTTVTITAGTLEQEVEGLNLLSGNYVLSWAGTSQGQIDGGGFGSTGVSATLAGGTNAVIEFNTGALSLVQLEKGSYATDFEQRPVGEELALCQRYFEIVSMERHLHLYDASGSVFRGDRQPFKVEKRAQPSLSIRSGTCSYSIPGSYSVSAFSNTGLTYLANTYGWSTNHNRQAGGTTPSQGAVYHQEAVVLVNADAEL